MLLFVLLLFVSLWAQSPYIIRRITTSQGGYNIQPSMNGRGDRVAFVSDRDLTRNPSAGLNNAEIFLRDEALGLFIQVTSTAPNRPGDGRLNNSQPSISSDGARIAFTSSRNLATEAPRDADGNAEIFLAEVPQRIVTRIRQITVTTRGVNYQPSLSFDGRRIAFVSDNNHTGDNPDGNQEIFLARPDESPRFVQITNTRGGSNGQPSANFDGTRIAFVSDRNPVDSSPIACQQIFLTKLSPDATRVDEYVAITSPSASGSSLQPSINAAGNRIAFISNQNLTDENPDGNARLFLWDEDVGVTQLTQVTPKSQSMAGSTLEPSLSALGTRIAFVTDQDPLSGNPLGNKDLFVWSGEPGDPTFVQVTSTRGGGLFPNAKPSMNEEGKKLAFVSNRVFTVGAKSGLRAPGLQDSHEEIYVAERPSGAISKRTNKGRTVLIAK